MPTLNVSKHGVGTSQASATFATARQNASTVSTNLTGTNNIQYLASAGRGSLTHQMKRTFLYFDTSGLTGTISNTSINIAGDGTNESADVIVLKSTAFGGDGSSNLASSEYFSSIDFSTAYSSEYDSWTATGTNNISLNSTANTDIQNNDAFICAIVEHTHDFNNTAATSATSNQAGVNFSTTITLTYTEAAASGPANLTSLNGIAKASITSANTITLANITSINTIA